MGHLTEWTQTWQPARLKEILSEGRVGWQRTLSGLGVALRADGSSGAHGVVKGLAVPVIGRITMDMSVFDISAVPDGYVGSGDYIERVGDYASLEDAARAAGTIGYEMLASLGRRYCRRYIK